jgi:hypothetical protein
MEKVFKSQSFKQLACSECSEIVPKVDIDTVSAICWKCVTKSLGGHMEKEDDEIEPEEC